MKVHGITDDDVADEPLFRQYAKGLIAFLDGADLGGFGAIRFDLPMLVAEFRRAGLEFDLNGRKVVDPLVIYHTFDQEQKAIQEALAGTEEDFFRYFPGKVFLPLAARSLGMDRKAYVSLICRGLASESEPLHQLGVELEATLTNYLPSRI